MLVIVLRRLVGLVVCVLASSPGCGDETGPADGAADASLPFRLARSPDGLGYCCPMGTPYSCGVNFDIGGFTETADRPCQMWSDISATDMTPIITDEHGCMRWDIYAPRDSCMRSLFDASRPVDAGRYVDASIVDAPAARDATIDDAARD